MWILGVRSEVDEEEVGIRFEIKVMLPKQHVLIAWFPKADLATALLGGRLKN